MRDKIYCSRLQTLWKNVFFFIFLVGAFFWVIPAYAQPQIDLTDGWQYRWGDSRMDGDGVPVWTYEDLGSPEWKGAQSTQNPPGRNRQKELWLRTSLPEGKWNDASIYVNKVNLNFEVYLEQELIYKFGELGSSRDTFMGWPFHIIPLEPGFAGKRISFRINSDHVNIGLLGRVTLGSRTDHVTRIIKGRIDGFILGFLLIFMSSFPIFILFIKPRRKSYSFGFLSLFSAPFGFFTLCSGVYMIARSQVKELFLEAPLAWASVELISLYLIPVGITLFFDRTIGVGYKSIVRRIWQAHLLYAIVALTLVGLKVVSLPLTSIPFFYAIIFDVLVLVATAIVAAIKGDLEAKIFTAGFAILTAFAIYDVFIALGFITWSRPLADWGFFIFVISLGLVLGLRIIGLYRDIEAMGENSQDIIYRFRFTPTPGFEYISPAVGSILGYTPDEFYADPRLMIKIGHPDDRKQLERYLSGDSGFKRPVVLRWVYRDGKSVWTEHQNIPVYNKEGKIVAFEGIARDVTERKGAEEQTQQHLDRLAALRNIDMAITASLDLRVTLNVLLDQVTSQLHVDAADILLLNPYTQILLYASGRGFRSQAFQRTRLRLGEGHAGHAALERRTVSIPDLSEDTSDPKRAQFLAGEEFISYHAVPLISKGQIKGVLEIFHRAHLDPKPEWMDFLETLSGQAAIAIDSAELFDNLQRSNLELTLAYDITLEGWSRALDLRDQDTEGHTQRVTEKTVNLARLMGLGDDELVNIRRGALLHDIGKISIPDSILLKPGPLTSEERETMCRHPVYAYEMLSPIAYLRPALDIPYCHHEMWDGNGYPRGLNGEAIPLSARIFSVVDVWDAMSFDRPYRTGLPEEKVREHVHSLSGTHFDPQVVEVFLEMES